ncbi:MAG: hypothetical protein QM800_00080 [Paludibacter sp.]
MKSNEFFKLIFNPFTRIAGWQAFIVGLAILVLSGIIGAIGNVIFDGIIDMHLVKEVNLQQSFYYLLISMTTLVVIMWITGLIISRGFRFIDIAGTMTLSKAPVLLMAIAGLFTEAPDMTLMLKDPLAIVTSTSFLITITLSIPVTIWSVALMYNALKVSCDAKGIKLTISFIIAILTSEVISKILIFKLIH